jgi:hypothetical protein
VPPRASSALAVDLPSVPSKVAPKRGVNANASGLRHQLAADAIAIRIESMRIRVDDVVAHGEVSVEHLLAVDVGRRRRDADRGIRGVALGRV